MTTSYIQMAITAGGTMTVFQGWPGKSYFRAKMEWNGEETITGKMALSIESAIEDLDTLLREDAAKECAS